MKIILGSSSKWRRQVLKDAGYAFTTLSPNIDERKIRDEDPKRLALAIAHAKNNALLPKITEEALLITTDQVVTCRGEIYEKPVSPEEARKFLCSYAKHPAATVSAVVVTNTRTGKRAEGVDIVNILFNPIPKSEIDRLVEEGGIFSCAGGFQVEGKDGKLSVYIKQIDGAIDSVKGLPLKLLERLMQEAQ